MEGKPGDLPLQFIDSELRVKATVISSGADYPAFELLVRLYPGQGLYSLTR
jgi:hypothetical protein